MKLVTYIELVERFGEKMADELLQVVEESTGFKNQIHLMSKEKRFHDALHAMRNNPNMV